MFIDEFTVELFILCVAVRHVFSNYIRHIEESRGCQDLVYRYIIAFVPRPTEEIMTELAHYLGPEHEQLFSSGRILMHPCSVYFFPFDSDLMSLELYGVLRDFHSVRFLLHRRASSLHRFVVLL